MTDPAVEADGHRSRGERLRRRAVTVPSLVVAAIVLTAATPLWAPVALVVDAVRGRFRFPLARLLAFGVCWTWIELAGVARAGGTFLVGRAGHAPTQYALMKWWAGVLMSALRRTVGFTPAIEGLEALDGGDAIVLARHASLADSLFSAWAIRCHADLWPRYVLKRELLSDPCLDIVGLRVPNHFLDRGAADSSAELAALRHLAAGVGAGEVAVIFPEGTRANDAKRAR
ncbi:MAG: lysophospholipid acyltransferase family protein, partial [Acidimicrobiia bacterium]